MKSRILIFQVGIPLAIHLAMPHASYFALSPQPSSPYIKSCMNSQHKIKSLSVFGAPDLPTHAKYDSILN